MKLEISSGGRKKIQQEIKQLKQNQTYLDRLVYKTSIFMPILERIFEEEAFPLDFKYLIIQESAFIGDAVSKSFATGYWQIKKDTAKELGLTINHYIDERMNLDASTRGAIKYFKTSNEMFDNWAMSLISYYTGRGGIKNIYNINKHYGKKKFLVKANTHWYFVKFLAYKILFEELLQQQYDKEIYLYSHQTQKIDSLKAIANQFDLSAEVLAEYNPCIKKCPIQFQKPYYMLIPLNLEAYQKYTKQEVKKGTKLVKKTKKKNLKRVKKKKKYVKRLKKRKYKSSRR